MATLLADFDTAHCGAIHDAQLDTFGQCLATASADGHIRLWDVRRPQEPRFLADLGGHAGAVHQVAWAPPNCGVLLASVSSDGTVAVWGRRARKADEWQMVRQERLDRYGDVRALAWAPHEHGVALACASADGTITVLTYQGPFFSGSDTVEHRWHAQSFKAHTEQACGISWATPPVLADKAVGMKGARLASAGDSGIRVWRWADASSSWEAEAVDQVSPADAQARRAESIVMRDVAWKPWDGISECLASAGGQVVYFWSQGDDGLDEASGAKVAGQWRVVSQVSLGEEVWKVSWSDVGGILLVSFGDKEQRTVLLKQRLDGVWDVMDVEVHEK